MTLTGAPARDCILATLGTLAHPAPRCPATRLCSLPPRPTFPRHAAAWVAAVGRGLAPLQLLPDAVLPPGRGPVLVVPPYTLSCFRF